MIGKVDRSKLRPFVRAFAPIEVVAQVESIDLKVLKGNGKKLILLDLDNTLTTWRSEDFEDSVVAWLKNAQSMGFQLALISNSIKGERSGRVGQRFAIPVFRGIWKPSRTNYLKALRHFQMEPTDAIMIGDQLITDVLGANRTGIEAIWVNRRGEAEFRGTKVNRWIENRLRPSLYKAMTPAPPASTTDAEIPPAAITTPDLKSQILKFAIVGATVWAINTALAVLFERSRFGDFSPSESLGRWMLDTLSGWLHWASTPADEATFVLWWLAALIAMFFSFWLNRTWTFGVKGKELRMQQLRRFYLVSIIGTIFNTILANNFKQAIHNPGISTTILAQGFSAVIVAFWNFAGQRFYAFREK